MSPTRRTFLQQASALSLLTATRAALPQHDHAAMPRMPQASMSKPTQAPPRKPMLHCLELAPFVDALPLPARLTPGSAKLRMAMRETYVKLHRDVPATRVWMYAEAPSVSPVTVSPVIEARSHRPLQIEWVNQLPEEHFLPIDHSLHGCGTEIPEVRTVTHLHGARVRSNCDGYPTDWFTRGHSRLCTYPLQQDATALWYHDHAMGLNRLNTYAGLFGQVLVRDSVEDGLHLPSGAYELPLTLYDRNFSADGQLFYPVSMDPAHPWVPEFSGDAILINGKIRPFVELEPRLYRLRLLNAANSRFFALSFSAGFGTPAQTFHQIGTDQGLLPAAVPLTSLLLAPAERADVLLDLSHAAGQTLEFRNGALGILQLRVAASATSGTESSKGAPTLPATIPTTLPTKLRPVAAPNESLATVTRTITLNEYQDEITQPMVMLLNRKAWHEPVTERPRLNATEIWEFVNLTEDTHPMHLHLVRFQLLDRRAFEPYDYLMYKKLNFTAPVLPPLPNERGWKDVIQCPAATVTRILVRFEGYTGKYLYHCHVLEHEANDMMRPFEVIA